VLRRGLFEKHKLIVVVQLLLAILQHDQRIDPAELQFLLFPTRVEKLQPVPENIAPWMSESVWATIHGIKELPAFTELVEDVCKSIKHWKNWMEDEKAEKCPPPQRFADKTPVQKLCLIRAMRPDRITNALNDWVGETLGSDFIEEPSFNMLEVYHETTSANPVFFVLFPGVNPYSDVEAIGKELGYTEASQSLRRISMGQGQEDVADKVIQEFSKTGGWVFLDNIHLMSKWLPILNRQLEICAEEAHENFRCFVSAEPHPDPTKKYIPQNILENSIKIINMPPTTLKANMRRAYAQFNQATFDDCTARGGELKQKEIRGMIFCLCFFHACLVGRHKFGSQGWSRSYGFNFGDLTISGDVIRNYLCANDEVPWKDVRYLISEVMYGGHITDAWDRRVDISYLSELMKVETSMGLMELAPGFKAPPPDKDYDWYRTYIEEQFPVETPVLFQLHNNAEIGFLLASAEQLFNVVTELAGGNAAGGGGGDGDDEHKADLITQYEDQLPENFNMIELDMKVTERDPYTNVVLQECERMNKLLSEMRRSLAELKLGLEGALNMSDAMEALLSSLKLGRVPSNWASNAFDSLKPLGPWFADLLLRITQLVEWTAEFKTPCSVWISGLFNPMAYITAILQTTARRNMQSLDKMEVWTDVTNVLDVSTITESAPEGRYIHGCCMEGARWDIKKSCVVESVAKDLHPAMPVINVVGKVYEDVDKTGIFDCPVYITTLRGPTFTFVATLKTQDAVNKWVLAGVAIMMSDDIAVT